MELDNLDFFKAINNMTLLTTHMEFLSIWINELQSRYVGQALTYVITLN